MQIENPSSAGLRGPIELDTASTPGVAPQAAPRMHILPVRRWQSDVSTTSGGLPQGGGWLARLPGLFRGRIALIERRSALREAALTGAEVGSPRWLAGLSRFEGRLHGLLATLRSRVAAATPEAQALSRVTSAVQSRLAAKASDPAAFEALLTQSLGAGYDHAKAESIRQQVLAGDFSWMPKIQIASAQTLADLSGTQGAGVARGAYVAETDTVYVSRELLLSDAGDAELLLAEELGHALDARLNATDAAGDEGEIFSKLLRGDKLSADDLAAMRADNDHGTAQINGRTVSVEYGWFKKLVKAVTGGIKSVFKAVTHGIAGVIRGGFKMATGALTFNFSRVAEGFRETVTAVKDTAKAVVKAVKDSVKAVHAALKEAFKTLMQSKIFAAVLMVCRFIPIPVVQLVVRIVDVVRAAYMVYQGVKNKSLSAVIGGIASLASGAGNVAGALGASASTVSTIQSVADAASKLSTAYNAIANKDLGAALSLAGGAFGVNSNSTLATAAGYAQQAVGIVQAARSGDALAALNGTLGLAGSATGNGSNADLAQAREVVTGLQAVNALRQGNLDAAQSLTSSMSSAQQAQAKADAQVAAERAAAAARAATSTAASATAAATETAQVDATATDAGAGAGADSATPSENAAAPATEATPETPAAPAAPQTLTVRSGDTLEAIARRQYGDQWRAGLAQLVIDNQIRVNQWGSPILRVGQTLDVTDLSQHSSDDLASLSRAGGRIVATNSSALQVKAEQEERARIAADAARIQNLTRYSDTDRAADPGYRSVSESNDRLASLVTSPVPATRPSTFTEDYDQMLGLYGQLKQYTRAGVEDFGVSGGGGLQTATAATVHAASEIGYTLLDAGLGLGRIVANGYDSLQAGTFVSDARTHVLEPAARFATDAFKSDVIRLSAGIGAKDDSADLKVMVGTDRVGVQYKTPGTVADSVNRLTYRWGDTQWRDESLVEKNFFSDISPSVPLGSVGGLPISAKYVPGARLNLSGSRVVTPSSNLDFNIGKDVLPFKAKVTIELRKAGS